MRILIAAGFLGGYGEADGVVTTYNSLLPYFEQSDLEVDFVAYGHENAREHRGNVRIIYHKPRIPAQIDPIRWIDLGFHSSSTARELAREHYDIIQSSTPETLGLWANMEAKRRKIPLLLIYHTALEQYAEIRFTKFAGPVVGKVVGNLMDRWLHWYFEQADLILAPSEYNRKELTDLFKPPIDILARGIDMEKFNRKHRTRTNGKLRGLYVGRVVPEKNLQLLIDIFGKRDDVELMIVGGGLYLDEMKRLMPNALYTGLITGQPLLEAYANADFFVFPSRTDTFGNVVLEGYSSGLPAVVTDAMGPKELVREGVTGFIAKNDKEFADAVERLIQDRELLGRMSAAALEEAKLWTWEAIFNRLYAYYEQLLKKAKGTKSSMGAVAA